MATTSQRCTRRSMSETVQPALGNYLAPFLEGPVGGHDGALVLVAPADQLEQQVGMPVRIRQVADLVDEQQIGRGVVADAPAQQGLVAHVYPGELPRVYWTGSSTGATLAPHPLSHDTV